MPYGVSKEHGGDSLENVTKMESCVRKVKRDNPGYPESRCIAICKSQLFPNKKRKSRS